MVDALIARGDEVVVLDDLSTGKRENLEPALAAGAALIEGSITDDGRGRRGVRARAARRRVFHLAAQIDVRRSVADPAYDLGVNVGGTLNLLERGREDGVGRFVFASTGGAIYGEGEGRELPLDETAECRPDAPYGQSKLAAEGYLGALPAPATGSRRPSLRLGNVYGPRQDPRLRGRRRRDLLRRADRRRARPTVFGDGEQTRDYVYVGDVADAFLAAADGAGRRALQRRHRDRDQRARARRARSPTAAGTEFEPEFAPPRLGEVQRIAIDPSRAGGGARLAAGDVARRGLELHAGRGRRGRLTGRRP